MVRAWYMDEDTTADQRSEHHRNPPKYLSLEDLEQTTGVLHWKLNADAYIDDETFDKIKKERGYSYQDMIEVSPTTMPNYEEKVMLSETEYVKLTYFYIDIVNIKIFYTEHLHTDEEIRFILEGTGYFDVRDQVEKWIRIEVTKGDMIVLPAGAYHRFTLDTNNYIKVLRLFVGEPVWTAHNRPADDMECRRKYLENYNSNKLTIA